MLTIEQRREAVKNLNSRNVMKALGEPFAPEEKSIYVVLKKDATNGEHANIMGNWFEPGVPKRVDGLEANAILSPTSDINIELSINELFELHAYQGYRTQPTLSIANSKDGSQYLKVDFLTKDNKPVPFNVADIKKVSSTSGIDFNSMTVAELGKLYSEKTGKSPMGIKKEDLIKELNL